MKPRKLTDAQVEWIREIARKRGQLPTNRQLAREFGCSERLIEDVGAARRYKITPTRSSWASMLSRCQNENHDGYPRYGGRGIKVCLRWQTYENFLADMGERPGGKTLDRIDNDGNYEPGNCRWATLSEQAINRRPRQSVGNHTSLLLLPDEAKP